jgi:hypothetical protein
MTHEEYKEALTPAALGEAESPERRNALEVHLAGCGECRAELRSLSDAAALLAFSPQPAAPSPELRSRILAGIKNIPQERPAGGGVNLSTGAHVASDSPRPASGRDGTTVAEIDAPTTANVLPFDAVRAAGRHTQGVGRAALLYGALAASLAIAALSVLLVVLWQRNNQLSADLARLSAQLEQTRSQLGDTRSELARVSGEAELLSAPDSQVTQLAGTEVASGARARLTFNETTGEAVLVTAKLPPAPAGKAYQLWYIAEGKPLPGSVFTTDASGRGELRERIPPEGRRAAVFAVTLEPAGGLPAPSGDIYLNGPTS